MPSSASNPGESGTGLASRILRVLRPSHQHSAFSATLLLMVSVMLARVIGYLREMYVAWAFGAGPKTDAYIAAFQIPDYLFYLLAGGTTSITFISIYARHTSRGEEKKAQDAFDTTVTIMTMVALLGTILVEIFTPQIARLVFPKFQPEQLELCVYLTRVLCRDKSSSTQAESSLRCCCREECFYIRRSARCCTVRRSSWAD